jgi:hypothetical protein
MVRFAIRISISWFTCEFVSPIAPLDSSVSAAAADADTDATNDDGGDAELNTKPSKWLHATHRTAWDHAECGAEGGDIRRMVGGRGEGAMTQEDDMDVMSEAVV